MLNQLMGLRERNKRPDKVKIMAEIPSSRESCCGWKCCVVKKEYCD